MCVCMCACVGALSTEQFARANTVDWQGSSSLHGPIKLASFYWQVSSTAGPPIDSAFSKYFCFRRTVEAALVCGILHNTDGDTGIQLPGT